MSRKDGCRRSGVVFASPLKAPSPLELSKYNPSKLPKKPLLRPSAGNRQHAAPVLCYSDTDADAMDSLDWEDAFYACGVGKSGYVCFEDFDRVLSYHPTALWRTSTSDSPHDLWKDLAGTADWVPKDTAASFLARAPHSLSAAATAPRLAAAGWAAAVSPDEEDVCNLSGRGSFSERDDDSYEPRRPDHPARGKGEGAALGGSHGGGGGDDGDDDAFLASCDESDEWAAVPAAPWREGDA